MILIKYLAIIFKKMIKQLKKNVKIEDAFLMNYQKIMKIIYAILN